MATYDVTDTESAASERRLERKSGIPAPRGLGASRNELLGLLLGLTIFAAIIIGFVVEVTR